MADFFLLTKSTIKNYLGMTRSNANNEREEQIRNGKTKHSCIKARHVLPKASARDWLIRGEGEE
eukprot:762070-Hanusia_phi.AAC.6